MGSGITSGSSAIEGKDLIRELEDIANRLRTESLRLPQTYTQPNGISSLAWAGVGILQPIFLTLQEAREQLFVYEYNVRKLVRLIHNMIVVLARFKTDQEKDDEKKWSVTAAETSRRLQSWVKQVLKNSPTVPIPKIPEDFAFTAEEVRECYNCLKESNHKDYSRWNGVDEDHPNINYVMSGEDIEPPPRWNDLPVHRMGAGTEEITDDEPHGWKKAIDKVSGLFKKNA